MQSGKSKYPIAKPSKPIKAGNDAFMPGSPSNYKEVLMALKRGSLHRKEVNQCAVHVVETAWKLNKK